LEYVDKPGDPKCIFDKLRLLLRQLPAWMRPQGFEPRKHDHCAKLLNPATGASITGEGGDEIGRGARSSIYFVDEAAHLEHPQLVERALSQTTRVRIDVSTPCGPGNPFAQKRHGGKVAVFTLHWKDDPRKGEAWYAEQQRRFDPVTVAQEIDIDYTASVEGICIPAAWVRKAVGLQLKASGRVVAGLDIAEYGTDKSVFVSRRGPVVSKPVAWGQCNTTETAHKAADLARQAGAVTLCYDAIGVGAGVRGVYESGAGALGFETHAVHVGASPTEDYWPDGKTSKEKFTNLRAELWWKLRARFERTYEHVTGQAVHRPEEMISLPDDPELIAELSQPTVRRKENGKVALESKDELRKRGVKSPNRADALALAFAADGDDWSHLASGRSDSVWAGSDVLKLPKAEDDRYELDPEDDDRPYREPRHWADREF
jgi:hypothetical protein